MIENYDILKKSNLHKIVKEYENERQIIDQKNTEERQKKCKFMTEVALDELEEINGKQDLINEGPAMWSPYKFERIIQEYTGDYYYNTNANLVRKYAEIYDKENLNKYKKPEPMPTLSEVMTAPYYGFSYAFLKRIYALRDQTCSYQR